jgi:signal transduction histidine kinase
LQEEVGKNLREEQASFLDKAFISSTQLAALVENLLSVSRIERGSLQIQTQTTAWEPIIEEAYNNFQTQAKERKVSLTYNKPKEKLPLVLVDKFRISEVISNLISNALNYTPAGGAVEVNLEHKGDEVITSVTDSGQGIPAQAIPKLFTKFFRVSGVLEQGSKGTGLGLYISKSIVDMHKGRIWVESEIGKGSKFSFTVPVSSDQTPTPALTAQKQMFLKTPK